MRIDRAIDGKTRLFGLIGQGLAHTASPRIQNRAAHLLGVNAVYVPFDIAEHAVVDLLELHWHLGSVGFNVTTPHKELVAMLVESGLPSVNTVYRGERGWEGSSTDAEGFARGLARINMSLDSFSRVVILGSGGVVAALLAHFQDVASIGEVTVLRRRAERDEALASAGFARALTFGPVTREGLEDALAGGGKETLLIQATSAPLRGDDLGGLAPALEGFGGVFVDLVYGKPSALYGKALALDLVTQDGEAMLIEQARLSQVLWFGRAAPFDELAKALRRR